VGFRLGLVRYIGLWAACMLLAGCASPFNSTLPRPPPAVPKRHVVFVGDSLTGGLFATTEDKSYPHLLVKDWRATIVARIGAIGAGAPGLLNMIDAVSPGATDVVVEIGTNDFVDLKLPQFQTAYGALIAALQKREPNARFFCLGLWQGLIGGETNDPAAPFDQVVKAACPGRFVDLLPLFIDLRNHGPAQQQTYHGPADWFHPNNRGHAAIAAAVESVA